MSHHLDWTPENQDVSDVYCFAGASDDYGPRTVIAMNASPQVGAPWDPGYLEPVDRPAIVVVNSDDAVVKKVQSTPGAVGLVDVYSITSGVTVLRVAGKLPLEPGYALHGH